LSDDGDGRRRKTLARATSATTSITRDLTVLSDVNVEVNSGITNGTDHQHTRMYTHWRSRIPNWLRSGTETSGRVSENFDLGWLQVLQPAGSHAHL